MATGNTVKEFKADIAETRENQKTRTANNYCYDCRKYLAYCQCNSGADITSSAHGN